MKKNYCFILLCVFTCVLLAGTAVATDYYVEPGAANSGGLSWDDPRPGITQVVNTQDLVPGDKIYVKAGVLNDSGGRYDFSSAGELTGVEIYGGFNTSLTGTDGDPATDRFADGYTIFDSTANSGGDRIWMIRYQDNMRIDGFSFQNATNESAIWIRDHNVVGEVPSGIVIANCEFKNNVVAENGPAILQSITTAGNGPSDFSLTLENCVFEGNKNVGTGYNLYGGAVSTEGDISIIGCTFDSNIVDRDGDSIFTNEAGCGGAVAILGSAATIDKSTFSNQVIGASTTSAGGSAVYVTSTSNGVASADITNSLFYGNDAGSGGARGSVYVHVSADGTLGTPVGPASFSVRNCTFDSNTATGGGAADVHQQGVSTTGVVENCIFSNITGNYLREQNGAGILNADYILAFNNTGGSTGDGLTVTNLLTGDPNYQNPGAGNYNIDASSAAYDAGKVIAGVTEDIVGTSRPFGTAYDIGAYEYDPGVNSPPAFLTGPYSEPFNIIAGDAYSKVLAFGSAADYYDADSADVVTLSVSDYSGPSGAAWLSFGTGATSTTLSGTVPGDAGVHVFTLQADDTKDVTTTTLTMTVALGNTGPSWAQDTYNYGTVNAGETVSRSFVAGSDFSDPDGDALTVSVVSHDEGPGDGSWLSFGTDASSLTLSGTAQDVGSHKWTLAVNDGEFDGLTTFTLTVENPGIIYVDQNASGSETGQSWTDAFTVLTSATEVAIGGDVIWVAADVYEWDYLRIPSGVSLYGGFAGTEPPSYDLSQRDFGTNETTFDGTSKPSGDPNSTIILIRDNDNNIRVDGFTIRGGDAGAVGGGILMRDAIYNITIANCLIEDNISKYGAGGGAAVRGTANNILFEDCVFQNNTVTQASAGTAQKGIGLAVYGDATNVTVRRCVFRGNYSNPSNDSSKGGAIGVMDGVTLTVDSCEFYDNYATDTSLFNDSRGGAIYVGEGVLNISNSIFSGNYAGHIGMAICVEDKDTVADFDSKLNMTHCTFHDNTPPASFTVADENDVIVVDIVGTRDSRIVNTVFSSEEATTTNTAFRSLNTVTSTTITGVFAAEFQPAYYRGGPYTRPVDVTTGTLAAVGYTDSVASDFHITTTSVLYNAGQDVWGLPSVDIEGLPRIIYGDPDIGAYEFWDGGAFDAAVKEGWLIYE